MLSEFREFLEKFNVVPIAVGLVLALAFAPLVDSVVNVVMSIVGKVTGMEPNEEGVYSFGDWYPGGLPVGDVINALITFIMIGFVVFMIVKALNRAGARTTPAQTPDQVLLSEIRDLLARR